MSDGKGTNEFSTCLMDYEENNPDSYDAALQFLQLALKNIADNPKAESYRKIVKDALWEEFPMDSLDPVILAMGFSDKALEYVLIPSGPAWDHLMACKAVIDKAMELHIANSWGGDVDGFDADEWGAAVDDIDGDGIPDTDWGTGDMEGFDASGFGTTDDGFYNNDVSSQGKQYTNDNGDEYRIFNREVLTAKRNKLIQSKVDSYGMDFDDVDLILRAIGFDKQRAWNEFCEDQKKIRNKFKILAPGSGKRNNRMKTQAEQTCPICFCDYSIEEGYQPECGHWHCNECWASSLKVDLDSEGKGVFASCMGFVDPSANNDNNNNSDNDTDGDSNRQPADGYSDDGPAKCGVRIPWSAIEKLIDEKSFDKYKKNVLDNFVHKSLSISFCPAPNCEKFIEYTEGVTCDVSCECSNEFCFKCKLPAHSPTPCDLAEKWNLETSEDRATLELIEAMIKSCPVCGLKFAKDRHCNHMICPGCQHHFCWLCLRPFRISSNDHPNYDECLVTDRETKRRDREAKGDVATHILAKRTFHKKKFDNAVADGKDTRALIPKIEKYERRLSQQNVYWVKKACNEAANGQRYLAWSFVFSYFLESCPGKNRWVSFEKKLEQRADRIKDDLLEACSDRKKFAAFVNNPQNQDRIKASAAFVKTKIQQMNEIVPDLEMELQNEADSASKEWGCIRCQKVHPQSVIVCDAPGCNTCRAHGTPDCLIQPCRRPFRICTSCTVEMPIEDIVCKVCFHCQAHNTQRCNLQPCCTFTPPPDMFG